MPNVSPPLERAARAYAGRRIAYDFGMPEENEVVSIAVAHRWPDYVADVRAMLAALAEPSDDILAAIKPAKERDEFVHQWKSVFTAILG